MTCDLQQMHKVVVDQNILFGIIAENTGAYFCSITSQKCSDGATLAHAYVDLLEGSPVSFLHHVNQRQCSLYCYIIVSQLLE